MDRKEGGKGERQTGEVRDRREGTRVGKKEGERERGGKDKG